MNNFDGQGNEGQQQPGQQMHPQLPPEAPSGSNTVPQNQLTESIASSAWLFDAIAVNYMYTMQLQEMLRLSGLGFLPEQAPAENTGPHAPDAFVNIEVPPARDPSSNPEQTGESTDNGGTVEEALDVENLSENGDQDVQEPVVVVVNESQPVAESEAQNPQEDDEQEPIIIHDLSDESSPEPESDDEIKCLGEFMPNNPHQLSFSQIYSVDGQKRAPSSDKSEENENRTNEPALSFTKVHSFVVNFDDAGGQDAQNLIPNPEHDQDASVPENTAVPLVENQEPGNEVSFRDEEFLLSLSEAQATESSTDSVINEEIEDPVDSLQNGTELAASNDRQIDLPETPTESGNDTMEAQIFPATTEDGLNVIVSKEDVDEDDLMSHIDPDVCRMAISPITFQEPQEVEMPLEQTGSNQSDEQLLQEDPMQCEDPIDPLQASNDDQNDHAENFQLPAEGGTDNASSAPMENQETVKLTTPQATCQPQEDQSEDATHSSTGSLQVQAPKSSARLPKMKKAPLPRRLPQKSVSEGGSRNEKMKKDLYPWGQDGFQRTMALWRSQRMWTKNLVNRSKMDKSELWSSGDEEPLVAMAKMMLGEEKARLLTESQRKIFVQIIKKSKGMIKEQLMIAIEMEMTKWERRKKTPQGNQQNRRNAMKRKYVFADEEESSEANGQRAKRTTKKVKSRL